MRWSFLYISIPEIITMFKEEIKNGEPAETRTDYIKFEARASTHQARGNYWRQHRYRYQGRFHFSKKGQKSPVTIGLYVLILMMENTSMKTDYHEMVAPCGHAHIQKMRRWADNGRGKLHLSLKQQNVKAYGLKLGER